MKHFAYALIGALVYCSLQSAVHAQAPSATQPAPGPETSPAAQLPASQSAPAPAHHIKLPPIGVDLGIFLPTDSKTRNRFGTVWTSVGLGIGSATASANSGRFGLDIGLSGETNGSDYVYVLPVGVSYTRAFDPGAVGSGQTFVQYFGFTADAVGTDIKSVQDNIHPNVEITYGGSATIGTTIGKSAFAEARYSEIAPVKGFDLSGLGLTVGIRF